MRNNKILAAAIASALSLGAGSAFAATSLELRQPGGYAAGQKLTPVVPTGDVGAERVVPVPVFASELFSTTIATTQGAATAANPYVAGSFDDAFVVMFRTGMAAAMANNEGSLVIKASLNNSATWGANLVPEQVRYCSSLAVPGAAIVVGTECNQLRVSGAGAAGSGTVLISKGSIQGLTTESTAEFVIQPQSGAKFTTSDYLFFQFDVDDLPSFKTNGSLSLTMEANFIMQGPIVQSLGSSTIEIARSDSGLKVNILPNADPEVIAVDVAQNYLQFVKGATNTKAVSLGTIKLGKNTTSDPKMWNGSTPFDFKNLGFAQKTATLTVTNGIFSASKAANAVFLDVNNDKVFTAGTDIAAVVNSDTQATWTLTNASSAIDNLYDKELAIVVTVDGTTPIATLADPPLATFELLLSPNMEKKVYTGKLRHIKDNGTKCTLYNIPDGTAGGGSIDVVSVRFTNKSRTRAGTVYGELFGEDGVSIYGSRKTLATVAEGVTVRLNSGEGGDMDLTFAGQYKWSGQRARLVITSDLQDVEVFALVRNINGGPSMNVSTGANGNGCVE
jgi:hypothetical protein